MISILSLEVSLLFNFLKVYPFFIKCNVHCIIVCACVRIILLLMGIRYKRVYVIAFAPIKTRTKIKILIILRRCVEMANVICG